MRPAGRLRELVEARADGRCEYCRRYQDLFGETFFQVEHIIPRAKGGPTVPDNLAYACRRCNLLKGMLPKPSTPELAGLPRCSTLGAIAGVITSAAAVTIYESMAERRRVVRQWID